MRHRLLFTVSAEFGFYGLYAAGSTPMPDMQEAVSVNAAKYVREQGLEHAIQVALAQVISEAPENAILRIGQILLSAGGDED